MTTRATVLELYALAGVGVLTDAVNTADGYVYSRGLAALGGDLTPGRLALALHDLAHYLVAPLTRRFLPNFGLGPHPNFEETSRAPQVVSEDELCLEEGLASTLNVALAHYFISPADGYQLNGMLGGALLYALKRKFRPLGEPEGQVDCELLRARGWYPFPRSKAGFKRLLATTRG